MTGLEIYEKVEQKFKRMEELFDPTTFVLNKESKQLEKEIRELQAQCLHEYVNGVCKFCRKEQQHEH
jgi:hypothetical protein